MEDLLSTNFYGEGPSNFGRVFQEVVHLLDAEGVGYVIVGTLALDKYVRPRFTNEIEILGEQDLAERVGERLATVIGAENQCHIIIRLSYADSPEKLHALQNRVQLELFGTIAPFASPLSLEWLFLESNATYAESDAGQLLCSGVVSAEEIRPLLEKHQSLRALDRLAKILSDIEKGCYTRTFNDYMKDRVSRLKQ